MENWLPENLDKTTLMPAKLASKGFVESEPRH